VLVQRLLAYGRLLDAERDAAALSDLARRVNDVAFGRARLSLFECIIALYRGPWLEALDALGREAALADDPRHRYQALIERAHWLARVAGPARADDVRSDLAAARAQPVGGAFDVPFDTFAIAEAEALVRIGDADAAAALLPSLGARPEPEHPWEPFRVRAIEALLEHRRGELHRASEHFEALLTDTREAGLALEVVWTQLDLGRALVGIDRSRAAAVLRDAARTAHELGAETLVELAEKELRSLGVRTWRRRPQRAEEDSFAQLTTREQEVVALLASGASNPEIAARLFLSRKTVERHVSNALAKARARNRAELAARYAARP
jgi:DNA-binding CsgD family transcriptional regulator